MNRAMWLIRGHKDFCRVCGTNMEEISKDDLCDRVQRSYGSAISHQIAWSDPDSFYTCPNHMLIGVSDDIQVPF